MKSSMLKKALLHLEVDDQKQIFLWNLNNNVKDKIILRKTNK